MPRAGADSFDCPGRTIDFCPGECYNRCTFAGVAKSVDAADLKSAGTKLPYRFKSGHRHQKATKILLWYFRCFFVLVSADLNENFLHGNSLWFCTLKQHGKHSALCKTGATSGHRHQKHPELFYLVQFRVFLSKTEGLGMASAQRAGWNCSLLRMASRICVYFFGLDSMPSCDGFHAATGCGFHTTCGGFHPRRRRD